MQDRSLREARIVMLALLQFDDERSHEAFGARLEFHRRKSRRRDARRRRGAHHARGDADAADAAGRHRVCSRLLLHVHHCDNQRAIYSVSKLYRIPFK